MREVIVHELCDPCWRDGQVRRESHDTVTVDLYGRGVKELDVCQDHYNVFIKPLLELLEHVGREPEVGTDERTPVKKKRQPCPDCGKPFSVGMGMTRHRNSMHGKQKVA